MKDLFELTRITLDSLLEQTNKALSSKTVDNAYGALYEYYGIEGDYKEFIEKLAPATKEEQLFIDFWYRNKMSVPCFIPYVGHLMDYLDPVAYRDSTKSPRWVVNHEEREYLRYARKNHLQIFSTREGLLLANKISKPLIRLGYQNKIRSGDDLPSIKKRVLLLKEYAEVIEKSVLLYGVTEKNPLLLRAHYTF